MLAAPGWVYTNKSRIFTTLYAVIVLHILRFGIVVVAGGLPGLGCFICLGVIWAAGQFIPQFKVCFSYFKGFGGKRYGLITGIARV